MDDNEKVIKAKGQTFFSSLIAIAVAVVLIAKGSTITGTLLLCFGFFLFVIGIIILVTTEKKRNNSNVRRFSESDWKKLGIEKADYDTKIDFSSDVSSNKEKNDKPLVVPIVDPKEIAEMDKEVDDTFKKVMKDYSDTEGADWKDTFEARLTKEIDLKEEGIQE